MKITLTKDVALAIAWVISLVSTLGALYIGEVLGQTPCHLCWLQRIFMFPIPIILGLGLWWDDERVGRYCVALSLIGGAIALWHVGLYYGVIPEPIKPCTESGPSCTDSNQLILGFPIPILSLFAFALICLFTFFPTKKNPS